MIYELPYIQLELSPPRLSFEMEFPLVLQGYSQQFKIYTEEPGIFKRDTVQFNLNPSSADSVIFPDIDSLVNKLENIRKEDLEQKGGQGFGEFFSFDKAFYFPVSGYVNRLILRNESPMPIVLEPLDGNEELLDKLGFPKWYHEIPYILDWNYR